MRKIALWLLIPVVAILILSFTGGTDNLFELSKNLEIFAALYRDVNTYYVDGVDPSKFMQTGINSMLNSLDPYTDFISESEIENYRFETTGTYGGVGAIIRRDSNKIVISDLYKGFPADQAGLKPGDILLKIDGVQVAGKDEDDISKRLKGPVGETVTLTVQHPDGSPQTDKTMTRAMIKVNSVPFYDTLSNNIGYIRLDEFTQGSGKEVEDALNSLESKTKLNGVILDLRGNPGGLLNEAIGVAGLFVNKGTEIVSTKGRVADWNQVYKSDESPIDTKVRICILVNSGSASASEIVTGCMQDLDRGVIIGTKTYGKGLVQSTRDLPYGTELKVTTAHYYTPSGRCIQVLDYAHRNADGSVGKIPDSLKHSFQTVHARTVFDGGGIDPDIKMDSEVYSDVTVSLLNKNVIFNYATQYALKHPQIPAPDQFHLTDQDFNDFISYIQKNHITFSTQSDVQMNNLIKELKAEDYYSNLENDVQSLQQKLYAAKQLDLTKYKNEIVEALREEIVSRYYYESGEIEAALDNDPYVKKAIDVLDDPSAYHKILNNY